MNINITSSARTGVCSPLPAELQPLEIHPSVDPELARGLLAACEYIADHFKDLNMRDGQDQEKGCVICHTERLSKWMRPDANRWGFPSLRGDWRRIYQPALWPNGYEYKTPSGVFSRVTLFLKTGL